MENARKGESGVQTTTLCAKKLMYPHVYRQLKTRNCLTHNPNHFWCIHPGYKKTSNKQKKHIFTLDVQQRSSTSISSLKHAEKIKYLPADIAGHVCSM